MRVVFSDSGKVVVTEDLDHVVRRWDASDGRLLDAGTPQGNEIDQYPEDSGLSVRAVNEYGEVEIRDLKNSGVVLGRWPESMEYIAIRPDAKCWAGAKNAENHFSAWCIEE